MCLDEKYKGHILREKIKRCEVYMVSTISGEEKGLWLFLIGNGSTIAS